MTLVPELLAFLIPATSGIVGFILCWHRWRPCVRSLRDGLITGAVGGGALVGFMIYLARSSHDAQIGIVFLLLPLISACVVIWFVAVGWAVSYTVFTIRYLIRSRKSPTPLSRPSMIAANVSVVILLAGAGLAAPLINREVQLANAGGSEAESIRASYAVAARKDDRKMLMRIADNEACPGDILRELARDRSLSIRTRVARHRSAPEDVLESLSADADWAVRRSVAGNPSTPTHLLERLAEDTHNQVSMRAQFFLARRWE